MERKNRAKNKSMPEDEERVIEQTEDLENWYQKIPSYLQVELKESENPGGSLRESSLGKDQFLQTLNQTHNHGFGDGADTPIDLSVSQSKHQSRRDVKNYASDKNPAEACASKIGSLEQAYSGMYNASSSTGFDGRMQGIAASHFSSAVWPPNAFSPNQLQMTSRYDVCSDMIFKNMASTGQNFRMTVQRDSPIRSFNPENTDVITKGKSGNYLQGEEPRPLKRSEASTSHSINTLNLDSNRPYQNWPGSESFKSLGLPVDKAPSTRNDLVERVGGNFDDSQHSFENLRKRQSQASDQKSNDELKPAQLSKKKKSHAQTPGFNHYCNLCDKAFNSSHLFKKHASTKSHLQQVNKAHLQSPNASIFPPNASNPFLEPTGFSNQTLPQPSLRMNLPVNLPSDPQNIYMPPINPIREISMMANSNYMENSQSQSSGSYKQPLRQIQPGSSSVPGSFQKSRKSHPVPTNLTNTPRNIHPLPRNPQSKILTRANPESGNVQSQQIPAQTQLPNQNSTEAENSQSLVRPQLEFFRVYCCMICGFFTDILQELELHVSAERNQMPPNIIIVSGEEILCQLCYFKTKISREMKHHCADKNHLYRVEYYNHVNEGGIHASDKLKNIHVFNPVSLSCNACEFATPSMAILKVHSAYPNHHHNVACCMYLSLYAPAVEYCHCRPCNVRTPTKRDLILHVRSVEHVRTLQQYSANGWSFQHPSQMFFIKELRLKRNENPGVSDHSEGSPLIGREKPHLKKENNEKIHATAHQGPVASGSASLQPLQPLPVSCTLCQQVFPEINILTQHLQSDHGVNKSGVKWIVSSVLNQNLKVHEEKPLQVEELTNKMDEKPKSTLSAQESSTIKKLLSEGMSSDSTLCQSSIATAYNLESESPACLNLKLEQKAKISENLNQGDKTGANSISNLQRYETGCVQNPGKSTPDPSTNQKTSETSSIQFSKKPSLNLDFKQERINSNSSTKQQFRLTDNVLSMREEKVPSPEKNLNLRSSHLEENMESETGERKYQAERDDSSSDNFSVNEPESPGLKDLRTMYDSSSSEHNSLLSQQLCKTEDTLLAREEMNTSSSEAEMIVEYGTEPNDDSMSEAKNENFLGEQSLATEHKLTEYSSIQYLSSNMHTRSSDHNSATPKRMLAKDDSLTEHQSLTSESSLNLRKGYDVLSCDNNSIPHQPTTVASSDKCQSLTIKPHLNESRERNDSSSSDHSLLTDEELSSTDESLIDHLSATENESGISQSGCKDSRKKIYSSSDDDDVIVDYKRLPKQVTQVAREKRGTANSSQSQYLLEQNNLSFRNNVSNDSPISRLMDFVNSTEEVDSNSVGSDCSGDSVNGQLELYDFPSECAEGISATNSPVTLDPQMQAKRNIENIEISHVFSLKDHLDTDSDSDQDNFENIEFSDQEDL